MEEISKKFQNCIMRWAKIPKVIERGGKDRKIEKMQAGYQNIYLIYKNIFLQENGWGEIFEVKKIEDMEIGVVKWDILKHRNLE